MKPEQDIPGTAAGWIAEAATGNLDRAQKAALTQWLRASPLHVREYVELTLLREDLHGLKLAPEQVEAWVREAHGSTATPFHRSSPLPAPPAGARARGFSIGLAASIPLLAISLAGYFWWQSGRYSTTFGEQRILTLADGSVVTLNTDSVLKVDFSDTGRMLELLKGEAFFRVAPDPSRPFEVIARDATVRALGTQFNVRIASRATVVSVLNGLVEVREDGLHAPAHAVRLGEGEETRIETAAGPAAPPPVVREERAVLRAAAWTRGRVEFEALPLQEVLNEFRRYRQFDVEVDPVVQDIKLTGSFDAQDAEAALAYIETLPGIVVRNPAPGRYVVSRE